MRTLRQMLILLVLSAAIVAVWRWWPAPRAGHSGLPTSPSVDAPAPRASASSDEFLRDASTCLLHLELFESFGGPAEITQPDLLVRWCLVGASVAGGSFCPTGNALRLNAPGDRARVLVRRPSGGCSSVTITFDYAQFAFAGSRVYAWATSEGSLSCTTAPIGAGTLLDVTGGICTRVTLNVPLNGAAGVIVAFDHGPNTNAILVDSLRIEASGCCGGGGGDCCVPGAPGLPGCGDEVVESCVCTADPFCCEVEWDALCAQAATLCGGCGESSCAPAFAADFGTIFQTGTVCARFPELFETCIGVGPFLTSSGSCAGPGDMAMRFGEGLPHSAAVTRCLDLSDAPLPRLSFSYTKNIGTLGPVVAISVGDAPFEQLWTAPVAFGSGCAAVTLDLSAFTGFPHVRLRFSSGSSVQNGAAFDDILLLTGAEANDCCSVGGAGCGDPEIEACVCAFDAFCCDVAYDELCVALAEYFGCTNCGLCASAWQTDFGSAGLPGTICAAFPELFVECEGAGPFLGLSGQCMGPDDAAMVFISGAQPSAVISRCLDLTSAERASLRFRYAKQDGTVGPIVEASADLGATWIGVWIAPAAPGSGCHTACADLSAFTGLSFITLRLRAGAPSAGGQVIDDLELRLGMDCSASGDLDGDGVVGLGDLLILLSSWGPCASCPADLNGDGRVDVADLLMLLGLWGRV